MTKERKTVREMIAKRKEEIADMITEITNELYDRIEKVIAEEYNLDGYDVIRVSLERGRMKVHIKNKCIFDDFYSPILPKDIIAKVNSFMLDLGYEEETESKIDTCLGQIFVYVLK